MVSAAKIEEIKASGQLPSPGGVARQVMQLTLQDDVTHQEIAHAIKADPVLSGLLVKVANAQLACQARPIASVVDAISVLGLNAIRQLVLGLSLIDNQSREVCPEFDYQDFWARSLLTAITAKNLVLHSGIGSPEEVFVLGLLGKIGSLAMATVYPAAYGRILRELSNGAESKLIDDERAEFGFDHNQLTQAMLADWGIPRVFQQVAEYHEDPMLSSFEKDSRNWRLLMVLHIADYFAGVCLEQGLHRRQMVPQLILMASRLGVELDALASLGDKSVAEWSEWSRLCTIRTAVVPPFAELLEAVPKVPGMLDIADDLEHSAGTFYQLRILLVDDDTTTLLLLKALLEKTGHTVMTAGTGLEGLGLIDSFKPQLIMTDWVMPEMDGVEFCKALRRNHAWRNIYVFILTAQEGVDKLVTAFEAGANDYMTKPIRPKMLVARLRAAQRVVQLQEEIEFDRRQLHQFADELAASNHRLRKSEVSLRAILDNSPYMTWLKDTEGRYVRVNKSYTDYVRRQNIDQVIGKTDFDFWPKEMAEQYRLVDVEVMASRQQKRIEETSLDGEQIHWVETFKTPVIDEAGKVLGTTGFARDITERIEREALRLTEVRKQRDVLVREVHHRIKNNLQGVVGLLQQNVIDHPEMAEVSQAIIGRIYSIATIHGLQAQALSEEVELDTLMKSIVDASGCLNNYVNELTRPVLLNKEETVPIALVLNELLTNACKHRSGRELPVILLKMGGNQVIVSIVNAFDAERPTLPGSGQGLNLVNSLLPREAAGMLVRRSEGFYTVELHLAPPVTIL